jgi:CRP/FNR family cyclic AMP-dependent transcriptional regulator
MRKPKKASKLKSTEIDPYVGSMLESIIEGKQILKLRKGIKLFSQRAEADAIYFIQSGKVKVTIASAEGKEAVLAMLGPRDFFGEGCLIGQSLRLSTAATIESSTIFKIHKRAMLQALHAQLELSEKFVASLLARNIDMEERIADRLFNHGESRLARILLKLSRYGQPDFLPDARLSQLSHETLADLVGTTPARISHFLNKFKRLGLIHTNARGEIMVRPEMLTDVVLRVGEPARLSARRARSK